MKRTKALNYFKYKFDLKKSNNGWYRFSSPLDVKTDKAAAVNFHYNVVKDFRHYAKAVGIETYIKNVENIQNIIDVEVMLDNYEEVKLEPLYKEQHTHRELKLPNGYAPIISNTELGQRARTYLIKRNVSIDYAFVNGIGFGSYGDYVGRIIIPYYNAGQLVYYQTRDFTDFQSKHKNPEYSKEGVWYNEDALYTQETVFIGEGFFDAVTMLEQGICAGGWSVDETQMAKLILSPCRSFVIMPDVGFYKKAVKIFRPLIKNGKTVKILDPTMYGGKDPNEAGLERILEIYKQTKPLTLFKSFI
jgi:hypothetical protein